MIKADQEFDTDKSTTAHTIDDPDKVIATLRRIHDSHTLLNVRAPRYGAPCTSALLDILVEQRILVLDELLPYAGQKSLEPTATLTVSGKCRGIPFKFASKLHTSQHEESGDCNLLRIPDQIEYTQRRSSFRVPIGYGKPIAIHLQTESGEWIKGQLHDLSAGGIGAIVSNAAQLKKGDLIPTCQINLPNGKRFSASLEVRFVLPGQHGNGVYVGGRFVDITPQQENLLHHTVRALERKLLRHAAHSPDLI